MHSRRSSSSLALTGSGSYDENNRAGSAANTESVLVDNSRITMKTRVAVRDHNPHRFQVVSLRDVGQLIVTRKDSVAQPVPPPTPSNSILKAPSGRLNPPCLQNLQPLSDLPSFQSAHVSNGNQLSNDRNKLSSKDSPNATAPARRRERERVQSAGETRPVLVELDLNSTPDRRTVKSDNLSHLSMRTNRRFVTIQQHLPFKTDARCPPLEPEPLCNVNSQIDTQHPGTLNESLQCLLGDGLSASHVIAKDGKPKKDVRTNLVKKVTFDLNHESFRSSAHLDLDEPRSKKRHAIYTQSLLAPYFYDTGYSDRLSMDAMSESSSSVEHTLATQGPPLLFQDEPCDPLKNGDWLSFLDEPNEREGSEISGHGLPGEPFELQLSVTGQQMTVAPMPCPTVAPLNFVLRLLSGSSSDGKSFDGEPINHKGITYPNIILDLFADIDNAIEGWR